MTVRIRWRVAAAAGLLAWSHAADAAGVYHGRDLRRLAAVYGFAPPAADGRSIVLRSPAMTLEFEADARRFRFNGVLIWMHGGVTQMGHRWMLLEQDFQAVVDPLLRPDQAVAGLRGRVIVLDPGHGGRDQGTMGRQNTSEKLFTLDVAQRVAARLRDVPVTVRLTRTGDSYLGLSERTDRAAEWAGDLFVSIHLNAAADPSVAGVETFVMAAAGCAGTDSRRSDARAYRGNRLDAANTVLGYYLQKGLLSTTRAADRGVKRARFEVLRTATCPAALVECGFVSNAREEARVLDPRHRDAIAEGLARGLMTYLARTRYAPRPAFPARAGLDTAAPPGTVPAAVRPAAATGETR